MQKQHIDPANESLGTRTSAKAKSQDNGRLHWGAQYVIDP